jgi:PAS domain S-box-containing protein
MDVVNTEAAMMNQYHRRHARVCAVDVHARKVNHEAFLSSAGLHLLEMSADEDLLSYIGQQVESLVRNGLVIVSTWDSASNETSVYALFGPRDDIDRLSEILGRSPIGLTVAMPPEYRQTLRACELHEIPASLLDMLLGQPYPHLSGRAEAIVGSGRIYAMPFSVHGDMLGMIAILTHEDCPLPAASIIETFIGMAAVAMQRRRVEDALRASEAGLKRSQEIAHLGSWELDVIRNRLVWSDEVYRIYGLQPQAFGLTYEAFLERVHPDDRAAVDSAYTGSVQDGKFSHEILHRVIRQGSGEIRWVHEKCQRVTDATGRTIQSQGMILDITERKQAEGQLLYQADLLQNVSDAIVASDLDFNITSWNRGAESLYGWRASDVIGKPVSAILRSEYPHDSPEQVRQHFLEHGTWKGDLVQSHRSGAKLNILAAVSIVRDGSGKPAGVVSVNHDVTERHRVEEALRAAHDELEIRVQERTAQLVETNRLLQAQIAERGRVEQSLRLERVKLTGILDAMPYGIYIIDSQRNVQYANPALEREFGLANGCKCHQHIHGLAEPCPWCKNDAALTGQPFQWEQCCARTGKTYELFDTMLANADGTVSRLKIMHDITERKRTEDEIQRHSRELAVLNTIGQATTSTLDLDVVLAELLDHVRDVAGAGASAVGLIEEGTGDVVFHLPVRTTAALGLSSGQRLKAGEGVAGWVIEHHRSAVIADVLTDPRQRFDVFGPRGSNVRSMVSAPLVARDTVIGVIHLLDERVGAFGQDHARLLEAVAAQAAIAIQNARLYKAEQHARQTAETLRGASVALTQTLDLHTVLEKLLDYVRQIVPYDSAAIVLLEGESRLVVSAQRGYERCSNPEWVRAITLDAQNNTIMRSLFQGQHSVLIADVREQLGWDFQPGTEHMRSWLGVPLTVEGTVIGLCGLDKAEPGFFTQSHLQLVEALVSQGAVAVQNAWLFEQVRAGRERLTTLSQRLVQVQDAERAYIARELHDEAGQSLTALLVGLRLLKNEADEPVAVSAGVDELSHMVEQVLEELHRLAVDLRPASLDHLGLVAALRHHLDAVGRKHGLAVGFEVSGFDSRRLPQGVETNLYRIMQEALTNIIRHAQASRMDVTLVWRDERVTLMVSDDGAGFDLAVALAQDGRLGLFGMRERAEMLGGHLTVESAPGCGTTIAVEIPYDNKRSDHR